jgi:hypothetical protein
MYNAEKQKIRVEIGIEIVQRYGLDVTEIAEALFLEMPICPEFDRSAFMAELDARVGRPASETE